MSAWGLSTLGALQCNPLEHCIGCQPIKSTGWGRVSEPPRSTQWLRGEFKGVSLLAHTITASSLEGARTLYYSPSSPVFSCY